MINRRLKQQLESSIALVAIAENSVNDLPLTRIQTMIVVMAAQRTSRKLSKVESSSSSFDNSLVLLMFGDFQSSMKLCVNIRSGITEGSILLNVNSGT